MRWDSNLVYNLVLILKALSSLVSLAKYTKLKKKTIRFEVMDLVMTWMGIGCWRPFIH